MGKKILTLLLTIFFGWTGYYRFKRKETGLGFVYLFTIGIFYFGHFYDIGLCLYDNWFYDIEDEETFKYKALCHAFGYGLMVLIMLGAGPEALIFSIIPICYAVKYFTYSDTTYAKDMAKYELNLEKKKQKENAKVEKQLLVEAKKEEEKRQQEIANQRIAENKEKGIACCPKCGSISITYDHHTVVTNGKNRLGLGLATSMIDPVAGIIVGSSKKKDSVKTTEQIVCLNCGHKWKI